MLDKFTVIFIGIVAAAMGAFALLVLIPSLINLHSDAGLLGAFAVFIGLTFGVYAVIAKAEWVKSLLDEKDEK